MPVYTNVNAALWLAPGDFVPDYRYIGGARLDSLVSPQATITLDGSDAVFVAGGNGVPWTGSMAVIGSAADLLNSYTQHRNLDLLLLYGSQRNFIDAASCERAILLEDVLLGSESVGVHNAAGSGGGAIIETVFTVNARRRRLVQPAAKLHLIGELPGCVVALTSTSDKIFALIATGEGGTNTHLLSLYWTARSGRIEWHNRILGSFPVLTHLRHYALLPLGEHVLVNTGSGVLAVEAMRSAGYRLLAHPVIGAAAATALRSWPDGKALIVTAENETWVVGSDLRCETRTLGLSSASGVVASTERSVLAVSDNLDLWLRQTNGRYVSLPLPPTSVPVLLATDNNGASGLVLTAVGDCWVTVDGGYNYDLRSQVGNTLLAATSAGRSVFYAIAANNGGASLLQSIDGALTWRTAVDDAASDLACVHAAQNGQVLVGGQAAGGAGLEFYDWSDFALSENGRVFWTGVAEWAMDKRSPLML